jgi:hypothetical protein
MPCQKNLQDRDKGREREKRVREGQRMPKTRVSDQKATK